MAKQKQKYRTLVVRVTVHRDDAEAAKESLMEAVGGSDFPEAIYETSDAPAADADAKSYTEAYK